MLISIKNLRVSYGGVLIVKDVSLDAEEGETIGIVGESGCGKSTMLHALMQLDCAASSTSESYEFNGNNLKEFSEEAWRRLRGKDMAMIFQNAELAMDPMKKISHYFYETARMHEKRKKKTQCLESAQAWMKKLNLSDTKRILKAYPYELSGGMCQRVAIAAAMMNRPKLILADEPTSALDVTSQAEVIKTMRQLKEECCTSMILVTHNMGVVAQLADKVGVMYAGELIEWGTAPEILKTPSHPYTRALLASIPRMDGTISEGIPGKPPEYGQERTGCAFAPRCAKKRPECGGAPPDRYECSKTHWVRCRMPQAHTKKRKG